MDLVEKPVVLCLQSPNIGRQAPGLGVRDLHRTHQTNALDDAAADIGAIRFRYSQRDLRKDRRRAARRRTRGCGVGDHHVDQRSIIGLRYFRGPDGARGIVRTPDREWRPGRRERLAIVVAENGRIDLAQFMARRPETKLITPALRVHIADDDALALDEHSAAERHAGH